MKILKARTRKNRIIKDLRTQLSNFREDHIRKMHIMDFLLRKTKKELEQNISYQRTLLEKTQPRRDYIRELEDRYKAILASEMELLEIKRKYYSLIKTLKI